MKKIGLEEIKERELKLLLQFSRFCDENNLRYVLAGGTLLGAVRHKGFIPWDDDIDVMMPRTDYEKFFSMCTKDFSCIELGMGNTCFPFGKILDDSILIVDQYSNENHCLWMDVFPIDGLPSSSSKNKLRFFAIKIIKKFWTAAQTNPDIGSTVINQKMKKLISPIAKRIGGERIARLITSYSKKYDFETSQYIGGIVWGYGPQERMPKREWLERVKVEFEGHKFWAPGCWDLYLRSLYGDYMKLPPEEKRITHNIVAYVKE